MGLFVTVLTLQSCSLTDYVVPGHAITLIGVESPRTEISTFLSKITWALFELLQKPCVLLPTFCTFYVPRQSTRFENDGSQAMN